MPSEKLPATSVPEELPPAITQPVSPAPLTLRYRAPLPLSRNDCPTAPTCTPSGDPAPVKFGKPPASSQCTPPSVVGSLPMLPATFDVYVWKLLPETTAPAGYVTPALYATAKSPVSTGEPLT